MIREANLSGPQIITRHGAEQAVLLSCSEYRRLAARRLSLVDFFRQSPLAGAGLDLTRGHDEGRPGPKF